MTKEEIRNMLPRVGDRRMEVPTVLREKGYNTRAMPCVVVYVNRSHMYYEVQFENGVRECYKPPHTGEVLK